MKFITTLFLFIFFCQSAKAVSPGFCPIEKDGSLRPGYGGKIGSIKRSADKDIYTILPSDTNPYGGNPQVWVAHKDKSGRIVRIESGGERPSEKLINFELEKRKLEKEFSHTVSQKLDKENKIPTNDSIKKIFGSPGDEPITFGKAIELYYEGDNCYVGGIKEKMFDPKFKRNMEKSTFSVDRCKAIQDLYSSVQKDMNECAGKMASHEVKLDEILNNHGGVITYVTSGVGGGGGSPIRSIASIIESEANIDLNTPTIPAYIKSIASTRLGKEQEMCALFAPGRTEKSSKGSLKETGTRSTHQ